MADEIPVYIPQETVNDDQVLIQAWRVLDGDRVESGQMLAEVETSKSVFEILSPSSGIVRLKARQGEEIAVGAVICAIHTESAHLPASGPVVLSGDLERERSGSVADLSPSQGTRLSDSGILADSRTELSTEVLKQEKSASREAVPNTISTKRFSRRAQVRMAELGITAESCQQQGLIRESDLERVPISSGREALPGSAVADSGIPEIGVLWKSAAGVPYDTQVLARSRRLEARILSWSSREAIQSQVSVIVPAIGADIRRSAGPETESLISAQRLSATAQLLREFPLLNACCLGSEVRVYREINLGYAIDAGYGLRVAVIRAADALVPEQIAALRDVLITKYLEQALLPVDLAGATFTVTDLSGAGVASFNPLIPEGQCGILGIGAEIRYGTGFRGYPLILSFDHRLIEGRTAALFLNRLKDSLTAFERSLLSRDPNRQSIPEPGCSRCGMTHSEATRRQHFLTEIVGNDWSRELLCTNCLQGR